MNKTVDTLFDAINGKCDLSNGAIADYIGTQCDVNLGFCLWSGLIKHKGVTKELAENCFKTNRIHLLLCEKNKHRSSMYFKDYLEKKYKLGGKFYQTKNLSSPAQLPIYDDNHCPTCNRGDYANNMTSPTDCCECYKIICKKCGLYNEKMNAWVCKMH